MSLPYDRIQIKNTTNRTIKVKIRESQYGNWFPCKLSPNEDQVLDGQYAECLIDTSRQDESDDVNRVWYQLRGGQRYIALWNNETQRYELRQVEG